MDYSIAFTVIYGYSYTSRDNQECVARITDPPLQNGWVRHVHLSFCSAAHQIRIQTGQWSSSTLFYWYEFWVCDVVNLQLNDAIASTNDNSIWSTRVHDKNMAPGLYDRYRKPSPLSKDQPEPMKIHKLHQGHSLASDLHLTFINATWLSMHLICRLSILSSSE